MAMLWFDNGYAEFPIKDCKTQEEVSQAIQEFLDEHNYKSYYTRMWQVDGRTKYDVGSWSQFFYWDNVFDYITMKENGEAEFGYDSKSGSENTQSSYS